MNGTNTGTCEKRNPISFYASRDGVDLKKARNACRYLGLKDVVTGWRFLTEAEWEEAMKPKNNGRPVKVGKNG